MCCPKPPEAHSTNILLILFSFYCRMGVYRMSRISVELHFPWFVLKSGSRIANFLLQAYLGEILLIVPFYSHSTVELKIEWVECTHTPQRFWNSRQTRIRLMCSVTCRMLIISKWLLPRTCTLLLQRLLWCFDFVFAVFASSDEVLPVLWQLQWTQNKWG